MSRYELTRVKLKSHPSLVTGGTELELVILTNINPFSCQDIDFPPTVVLNVKISHISSFLRVSVIKVSKYNFLIQI